MVIAFWGIYPTHVLMSIIISWWLYKVVMGFFYTPLAYLGIYLLRGKDEVDEQIRTASVNEII
jgi:uncharacterized PurR-regulated membrane protein YhhQ (DUF165 family)